MLSVSTYIIKIHFNFNASDICLTNVYGCGRIAMNPLYSGLTNHKTLSVSYS